MKNLLIISGNSSLGKTVVLTFLKNKYKVFSTYRNKKIRINNKNLFQFKVNIQSMNNIKSFQNEVSKKKFDYVIFCNGILLGKDFNQYTSDDIKTTFDINLFSSINFFKIIKNNIKKDGLVVFISSISSERGSFDPFYAASKAALNMVVKNISKSFSKNFRIITISPSLIENTKMYYDMSKKNIKLHKNLNPQKSLIKKSDISNILLNIKKNFWYKLNGINLNINGGI